MKAGLAGKVFFRSMIAACAVISQSLLFSGEVRATTRLVPEEYPTIQAGVDASAPSDTVLLAPGTYTGEGNRGIEFRGKDIVLTSRAGAQQTIIDCGGRRGFYIHEHETLAATIQEITIQNGWSGMDEPGVGGTGGAIYCGLANLTVSECVIVANGAEMRGGGAYVIEGSMLLRGCVFAGNSANEGGGVMMELGSISLVGCVIVNNSAVMEGGGIELSTGINGLLDCTISGNTAEFGGGIGALGRANLTRCILWGNDATRNGKDLVVTGEGAELHCCAIDSSGVYGGRPDYDAFCIFSDPFFCGASGCGWSYGSACWTLHADSPCLPERSPCGALIGALGQGCGPIHPVGACCLPNGSCSVLTQEECGGQGGRYQGAGSTCTPNPCQPTPTRATTWGRIKTGFR